MGRAQGPWHVGDVQDVFGVVVAWHTLRRGRACQRG